MNEIKHGDFVKVLRDIKNGDGTIYLPAGFCGDVVNILIPGKDVKYRKKRTQKYSSVKKRIYHIRNGKNVYEVNSGNVASITDVRDMKLTKLGL